MKYNKRKFGIAAVGFYSATIHPSRENPYDGFFSQLRSVEVTVNMENMYR